jgi:TetR/AcrR family transcriptional repressor of mexJK operon
MTATIAKAEKRREADVSAGRRSDQKRSNLLAVASELFLAKGYDGVSLDEIIAAAGGSKTTIYSYFKGKEGVFVAAVAALCDDILAKLFRTKASSMPLREALQAIGQAYLDAVLSPRAVALQRLVIGEAHRFPEVGRIWFESGPVQTHRLLTDFFEERQRAREIGSVDPRTIAILFHDMLTLEIHQQVLLGIMAKPKRAVLADKVRSAIDILLNGCKAI